MTQKHGMSRTAAESGERGRFGFLGAHPMGNYYLILGSIILLLLVGLMMVLSASSVESYKTFRSSYTLASRQGLFAFIGLVAMFILSRMEASFFRKMNGVVLVGAVLLLVLVFVPGFGVEVYGQRNWIKLFGPFRLQPSEFAKLGLVIWAAAMFAHRRDGLPTTWKGLLNPLLVGGGLLVFLVLLEGDMGNALILSGIIAVILFVVGAPMRVFAGLAAVGVAGVFALSLGAAYRMKRFSAWLDPESDPGGAGWQLLQGKFAFGTGGWFGVGLGASREKWGSLPEAHTDFIFPVLGEETGLLGTLMVLALIGLFTFASLRVAFATDDIFIRVATCGVVGWIVLQAMINIGAVLQLLPITGVPLPLVSYGGSSLLPTLMAVGMVLSFARNQAAVHAAALRRQDADMPPTSVVGS